MALVGLLSSVSFLFSAPGDENWKRGFVLPPGVDGEVNAMAVIGRNLYVGGRFEKAGGLTVNSLARWDGTRWHAMDGGVQGVVYALAASGTNLYVGGWFTSAGSIAATNLACWNGSEWRAIGHVSGSDFALIDSPSFGFQGPKVLAILATNNELIVSGAFREAGGVAATNIAKWDGTNWISLGPGLGNSGGYVAALSEFQGRLHAAGAYITSGENRVTNLASWSGTDWLPLGSGTRGPTVYLRHPDTLSGFVFALAPFGNHLYASGDFTEVNGINAAGAARWDGSNWEAVVQSAKIFGEPRVWSHGSSLYLLGKFDELDGVRATNIARWDGSQWFPLPTTVNGDARAAAFARNSFYVGGDFGVAGRTSASGIVRFRGARATALGRGMGNIIMGFPTTLAVFDEKVVVAGSIHTAGKRNVNNVATWNGRRWSTLGTGISHGYVATSVAAGTNYYVGGDFVLADISATNLACWNGRAWTALGAGLSRDGAPPNISAMTAQGSRLYVAGNFTHSGGTPMTNVAVWDGTVWSQVGEDPPPANHYTQTMFADAGELYFASISSVWRWDGTNWSSFGSVGEVAGIQSIASFRGHIYIGGFFTSVNGIAATNMARWNGSEWSAVNCPFQSGYFPALAPTDRYLYVGGQLQRILGGSFVGIARYDGTNWSELGSGVIEYANNGSVLSLAVLKGQIFATGYFKAAGGKQSYRFAAWKEE